MQEIDMKEGEGNYVLWNNEPYKLAFFNETSIRLYDIPTPITEIKLFYKGDCHIFYGNGLDRVFNIPPKSAIAEINRQRNEQ